MKRTGFIVLVAALALVLAGLYLAARDPATSFTESRAAWEAYEEGEWLMQSYRHAEAREKLTEAVSRDPGFALARVALAELDRRMGLGKQADARYTIADSLTALTADPEARLILQVRLSNAQVSRYHEQRDSLLAVAKEVAGDDIIVLVSEATRAAAAGELEHAEQVWKHVLEINPNYAAAYNFLGYLYLSQGRYEEAETAMRRYAFVAPDLANPHDSLGDVLMTTGRLEEALAEFRTALDKQDDFFHSLVNSAEIYVLRGQVDRANELLDQVIEEVAGTTWEHDVAVGRLRLLFEHRITDDLAAYAARYVGRHPDSHFAPHVRSWRHIALGEPEAAAALIDSLAASYRQADWYAVRPERRRHFEANTAHQRGLLAELVGDHQAAVQRFARALELMSDSPVHVTMPSRVHLAWSLVPLGEIERAREQIGAVLAVNPRQPEAVLVAAFIEAAAGETAEAHRVLDTLEQMLAQADPDFPPLVEARRLRDQLPAPGRI